MYLSRLVMNPRSREVRRDLADCYALHRTLLRAFPAFDTAAEGARAQSGVLYRVEPPGRAGTLVVLVQSQSEPDWGRLPLGYLLSLGPEQANPAWKRVDGTYASLVAGTTLAFRLRANPTRKIDTRSGLDGQRRNGRRVELRQEAEQLAWLARKSEQAGFRLVAVRADSQVPDVRTGVETKLVGRRPSSAASKGGDRRLTFGSVLFDGELCITDAERFRQALAAGIGPGKAFGFGLLSVARPKE
jgi:CRISPR system Cascade subunit CasE